MYLNYYYIKTSMNKTTMITLILSIFLIGLVSAELGYNNPKLPNLVAAPTSGGTTVNITNLSGYFVPYTGATGNVDLGSFDLSLGSIIDSSSLDSIDPNARIFYANDGATLAIDYSQPSVVDFAGQIYTTGVYPSSNPTATMYIGGGIFQDNGGFYAISIDTNTRTAYSSDGSTPSLIWDMSTGNGIQFNPSGTYNGRLGSNTEAGYFYESAGKNIYLVDGTYVVNAIGDSLFNGDFGILGDLTVNNNGYMGYPLGVVGNSYFTDSYSSPATTVSLIDGTYAVNALGQSYFYNSGTGTSVSLSGTNAITAVGASSFDNGQFYSDGIGNVNMNNITANNICYSNGTGCRTNYANISMLNSTGMQNFTGQNWFKAGLQVNPNITVPQIYLKSGAHNWTIDATQGYIRFGNPSSVTLGINMIESASLTISTLATQTNTQSQNILNNFDNYAGLLLKRISSGTSHYLRLVNGTNGNVTYIDYKGNIVTIGNLNATNLLINNVTILSDVNFSKDLYATDKQFYFNGTSHRLNTININASTVNTTNLCLGSSCISSFPSGFPGGSSGDVQTNDGIGGFGSVAAGTGFLTNDGYNSLSYTNPTILALAGDALDIQINDGSGNLGYIPEGSDAYLHIDGAGNYNWQNPTCTDTTQDVMYSPSTSNVCFYDYYNNYICVNSFDSYSSTTITYVVSCP